MAVGDFRELLVWQKAMRLTRACYELARELPIEERFALAGQLRRAAFSVPLNIAEGHTSPYRRDFLRYLRLAHGSAKEVECALLVCAEVGHLDRARIAVALAMADEVGRMLRGMRRSLGEAPPRQRTDPP